ncbi:hypothetical protein [Alteromonas sp. a30]|uniref:hypothetical protein n=1 Tax=Alteromonas sp. a30 TaxID=2730917 RepID=UPI00228060BA|nr:hypothetical protein [Alteromonas sp. a30]MCY7296456.1 hypothetical protein [Alteromonas sp. a30]
MKIRLTFPTTEGFNFTFKLSETQAREILKAKVDDSVYLDGNEEVVTIRENFIEHFQIVNSGTSLETLKSDSVLRILKQNLKCDAWEG